jgi:TusA-related sulfurtransferase
MEKGWIKIHRKMTEWEWYDDIITFKLFIHLLLTVNYEDKEWHGILIKKGQIVTSRGHLAKQLNVGDQQIRTALTKLKSTSEITIKTTNKYTIITILNWIKYQQLTNKLTNEQPTTNQQLTTTKELKELKEIKKGNLLDNLKTIMYNYYDVDEDGNPILKKRLKRINKIENTELIKVGLLWRKMCAESLKVRQDEVVMKNIYYPIRAVYDREKYKIKDFEGLFKYFLNDKNIKQEDKMGFDLMMSEKYVAKYKLAKRSSDKPISNAQIAEMIKL